MSETNFEWDEGKNTANLRKHGVSFYEAQHAFLDENRVIAEDLNHSQSEQRYYCFGLNQEGTGVLTVRFTYRSVPFAFVFSVGAIGAEAKRSMNKQIRYSDEPLGEVKLISDFLPSPKELALKNEQTKVTISLSSESVAFFKEEAKKHHMQYQKMIRQLLDEYVAQQKTR